MNILHIGEYASGGVATYLREVINYQKKDANIKSVSLVVSEFNSEKDFFLEKHELHTYKYKRGLIGFIRAFFSIRRSIKNIDPDIVHIHSTIAGAITRLYFFISRKKNIKIIYCSHGWAFLMDVNQFKRRIYEYIERFLAAKKTDLIINISRNEMNKSVEIGIDINKSIVIYNGINKKTTKYRTVTNKKSNLIKLLFVGRFDQQKGIDILLSLLKENDFNNFKLYLIGESVLNNSEIKVPNNVEKLGWVDNEKIDYYYQNCDALIVPSRWEGFGLVAIEAMKNKRAVIASNKGALPEIITNKKNGYLFDIDNPEELKNILTTLNKETLKQMGIEGYKIFEEKFTSEKMNRLIVNEYKKILNK